MLMPCEVSLSYANCLVAPARTPQRRINSQASALIFKSFFLTYTHLMATTHTLHLSRPRSRPEQQQTASAGKGMPARVAQPDRARFGQPQTLHDASVEASLALPHERDQSTDMTADKPDPVMTQAQHDLSRGIKDTSKSPEMDRAYKRLG